MGDMNEWTSTFLAWGLFLRRPRSFDFHLKQEIKLGVAWQGLDKTWGRLINVQLQSGNCINCCGINCCAVCTGPLSVVGTKVLQPDPLGAIQVHHLLATS